VQILTVRVQGVAVGIAERLLGTQRSHGLIPIAQVLGGRLEGSRGMGKLMKSGGCLALAVAPLGKRRKSGIVDITVGNVVARGQRVREHIGLAVAQVVSAVVGGIARVGRGRFLGHGPEALSNELANRAVGGREVLLELGGGSRCRFLGCHVGQRGAVVESLQESGLPAAGASSHLRTAAQGVVNGLLDSGCLGAIDVHRELVGRERDGAGDGTIGHKRGEAVRLEGDGASLGQVGGGRDVEFVFEGLTSTQGGQGLRRKALGPVQAPDTLELQLLVCLPSATKSTLQPWDHTIVVGIGLLDRRAVTEEVEVHKRDILAAGVLHGGLDVGVASLAQRDIKSGLAVDRDSQGIVHNGKQRGGKGSEMHFDGSGRADAMGTQRQWTARRMMPRSRPGR
jgi:hypothetical protein